MFSTILTTIGIARFLVGITKTRHVFTGGVEGAVAPKIFFLISKQISPTSALDTTFYWAAKKCDMAKTF